MRQFIEDIFGEAIAPERRLAVFTVPDRRTRLLADPAEVEAYARTAMASQDVYFGLGLIRGTPAGRGKAEDVAAIGCLWADIDLAGEAHPGKSLPASVEEAKALLAALPLAPSMLVCSGYGLHAYWLLKEPWLFDSPEERAKAARLAKGWHGAVCAAAASRGWSLENLGDLTRILRLPGTVNHKIKGKPAEVRVVERNADLRYNPDDFEPFIAETPEPAIASAAVVDTPTMELPAEKLAEALEACPQFRRTWERKREDLPDNSQSGYDLSLATTAALRGWTDAEIGALIRAHRAAHGQNPAKATRSDYLRRTIGKARAAAAEQRNAPAVDLSRILPEPHQPAAQDRERPSDPGPFPAHLLQVPGLIGEVMSYNLATSFRPQPVLALAGAICLQAVLAARKVRDERGNRTNLYFVGVAPSGGGKDHARKVNRNVLFHAGLQELEGNEDVASDAGLVAAAEVQPAILFQLDEFGRFLRTIGDPKRAPHLYNVLTTLMKLYSCADTVFRGKAYADTNRNKTIDQPCASVYGTTVPEHFYESLTADALQDGFVARLMVLEGDTAAERQRVPQQPVPEAILDAARWWGAFNPGGNLGGEHPDPAVVPCTPEAGETFDALAATVDVEMARQNVEGRSLWARAEEKACRLALVHACSANRSNPVIDAPAARWACAMSEYMTRRMLFLAHQWVSDGFFDARQKKVVRIIRQAGGRIVHTDLIYRTRSLTPRERQEVIENLIQTGQIQQINTPTATKPRVIYAIP